VLSLPPPPPSPPPRPPQAAGTPGRAILGAIQSTPPRPSPLKRATNAQSPAPAAAATAPRPHGLPPMSPIAILARRAAELQRARPSVGGSTCGGSDSGAETPDLLADDGEGALLPATRCGAGPLGRGCRCRRLAPHPSPSSRALLPPAVWRVCCCMYADY